MSTTDNTDTADEEPGETKSTASRFWLTNDLLAYGFMLFTVAMMAAAGLGLVDLGAVPENWRVAWAVGFMVSVVWAFGSNAASTVMDSWGGGGGA